MLTALADVTNDLSMPCHNSGLFRWLCWLWVGNHTF